MGTSTSVSAQSGEDEKRVALLDRCLEAASREYAEHCENWKAIETKAQATAGASAVFLGALLAAITKASLSPITELAIAAAIISLLASFGFALRAVRIGSYTMPHDQQSSLSCARRMIDGAATLSCAEAEWLENELEGWPEAIASVENAQAEKAKNVRRAHVWLSVAVLSVTIGTLATLVQRALAGG